MELPAKKQLPVARLAALFALAFCLTGSVRVSEGALYIPRSAVVTGVGGARSYALDADMRVLETAALQFSLEEPRTAASLEDGNHIALLARYADAPGKFAPGGAYSFYVLSGEWWIGAVVAPDAGREVIAAGAENDGLYGSPDIDTPPSESFFQSSDAAAWKKIR